MSSACSKDDIEKAIEIIKDSRRSHETWLIWYEREPAGEAEHAATCGDSDWHRKCIAGYDHVLSVLERVKNEGS